MNKAGEFLGQVKAELQKVTWPTRKETYGTTVVWGVDTALSTLIRHLIK
jgi:preprotein translocase subunit SecE